MLTKKTTGGVTVLGIPDGKPGEFLSTDGSGTLSFATPTQDSGMELLGSCTTCSQWNGQVCIDPAKRGMFSRYMVRGTTCCYGVYCSSLAMRFAGASNPGMLQPSNDCDCNRCARHCEAHASCGAFNQWKCFDSSTIWACGGQITAINGCDSGCSTACANQGYAWEFNLYPANPCVGCDSDSRMARFFHRRDGGVGGDSYDCCAFFHNVGRILPCCGAHSGCLQSMCWSTNSANNGIYGKGSIQIYGLGRITRANDNGDGTSWIREPGPNDNHGQYCDYCNFQ